MVRRIIDTLTRNSWLRITLAVALILVGTAPIGAPILSDASWRQADAAPSEAENLTSNPPAYEYRWNVAGGLTAIERSEDAGKAWQTVASVPEPVVELYATPGDESTVYARSERALWISRDGGANWEQASSLPSRPLALAVSSKRYNAVYAGTESLGLAVSRDRGETWQVLKDQALSLDGAAPVAVTAITIDPDDESIVYAAAGVWTGTSTARLTAMGVFVTVDGGATWQLMEKPPLSMDQVTRLSPAPGKALAVQAVTSKGARTIQMQYSDELSTGLKSSDPAVRAATAKILGLLGDKRAAPALVPMIEDEDLLAGDRAAEALGRLNATEEAGTLRDALTSQDEAVRARAALALGLMRDESAVGRLAGMVGTDGPLAARRAAEALATIGTPAAIAGLTARLGDAELTPARHAAMTGLELAGQKAVQPLVASLDAKDAVTRANAAEMLGFIGADEAVAALAQRLDDESAEVRQQAAWALGEIGTSPAAEALRSAKAGADEQTLAAIQTAQSRADAMTVEAGPSIGELLLTRLASIPLARWTWFALMLFLAAALLLLVPREAVHQRARHRR